MHCALSLLNLAEEEEECKNPLEKGINSLDNSPEIDLSMDFSLLYLEKMRKTHIIISNWYNRLSYLYQSNLWVLLAKALEDFTRLSAFQRTHPLIELYHNFITDLQSKFDPLMFAELAV